MWPEYHMFFRKQCWHLQVSEWTLGLINALKYHWSVNQLIFISSCFEACHVQRFHLQEVYVRDQFCILPRMKKPMTLFCIKNFSCHVTLASYFLKENFIKWVTSGLLYGSNGSTGVTHFQPWYIALLYNYCFNYPLLSLQLEFRLAF